MKAVQFEEYGGPEVLHVADVEEPHAGPGQVRVAVRAAGVNPMDYKLRAGMISGGVALAAPTGTALDAAGVVDEVGEGVTGVEVGDEVFGATAGGAAAEYAVLAHWAAKPAAMSFEEAAGLPVAVETSLRAFREVGLKAGDTLLINGAAGGVGLAAVQLAQAEGVRTVVGTASEGNHEFLRHLGVIPTTYGPGLVGRVRELLPEGVDVAFDTAGHGELPDLVELTGDPQKVVTIASFDAAEYGVRLTTGGGDRAWDALERAARLFTEGRFSLPVARTFSFADAADAHRLSEGGHVRGKLVLTPGGPATA
jgi:NADPH:quinone reductase-like Zn-dependent oxidoreductase